MKIRTLLFIFLALSSITGLYGQNSGKKIKLTGFVVDVTSTPVQDAIIMVDGEKTDIITDSKGFYKIKIKQDNKKIGVFTSSGGIIEEAIEGRSEIDFAYKIAIPYHKTEKGDESVDIGYGNVNKKDLTSPVGKIDGTKSKYAGYKTIYDLIRGQVPGVQVNGTSIMIRSASSVSQSNEPLFVVDGVPVNSIDNIMPSEVKTIEVLKGSSASIYGTRGSNGVILIKLLKGNDK